MLFLFLNASLFALQESLKRPYFLVHNWHRRYFNLKYLLLKGCDVVLDLYAKSTGQVPITNQFRLERTKVPFPDPFYQAPIHCVVRSLFEPKVSDKFQELPELRRNRYNFFVISVPQTHLVVIEEV